MKRSRNFKVSDAQKGKRKSNQSGGGDDDDGDAPMWSGFENDLPKAIFIDILLRLPMKSILISRCVCKTWRGIISDPEFAKLQFQNSQLHLMLRTNDSKRISRTLFLVEVEPHNFNHTPCNCEISDDAFDVFHSHVRINLDTKFNIPLRDVKMVLDDMLQAENLKVNSKRKRKPSITARPTFDKFGLVNSCNGLLCLCEPKRNNPVTVCNPITGEFIKIPEAPKIGEVALGVHSGFGFSPNTNQYKVVRMYSKWDTDPRNIVMTDVYTLGKGWRKAMGQLRDVISHPCLRLEMRYPTYLNGEIYWFHSVSSGIVSFDVETELFQMLPMPHYYVRKSFSYDVEDYMSMGVLRGNICICDHKSFKHVDIWMMKDHGVQGSWINMFHIEFNAGHRWLRGPYQVIKGYESGAVLMFHPRNYLVYHDPKLGFSGFRYFKIRGSKPKFEAFTHVPSLFSLKDVLAENEIEVLNVNSRCGRFRLREENLVFCFEEVNMETENDSESSSSHYDYQSDDWN